MMYKRSPSTNRKYIHPQDETNPGAESNNDTKQRSEADAIERIDNIPLPNEDLPAESRGKSIHMPVLRIFNQQIFLDEIIIVGLLFLLWEEGMGDELLILALVFVLFAGRD